VVNQVGRPRPKDVFPAEGGWWLSAAKPQSLHFWGYAALRHQPPSVDFEWFPGEIPDFFAISGKTAKLRLYGMAILDKIPRLSGSGGRERIGKGREFFRTMPEAVP